MAMTINTNIQSLNAQRNLGTSQSSLSTSMQRLSSGLRINSAKDDAAGLAIAERMSAQIRGLNQAQRNANDGVSLAQTAEGALGTIGGNLQRIRELAVQSRNATNSDDDRAALQKEVDQLKSEIDRVADTTSFNGTKLLDGSFTSKAFQVGANQGQTISVDSIANAKIDQLGSWTSLAVPAKASSYSTQQLSSLDFSKGATAFAAATSGSVTTTTALKAADLDGTAGHSVSFKVDGHDVTLDTDLKAGDAVIKDEIQDQLDAKDNGAYTVEVNAGKLTITKTATGAGSTAPVLSDWNQGAAYTGTDLTSNPTSTAGKASKPAVATSELAFDVTLDAAGAPKTTAVKLDANYTGKQDDMIAEIQKQLDAAGSAVAGKLKVTADGQTGFKIESKTVGSAAADQVSVGLTAVSSVSGFTDGKAVQGSDAIASEVKGGFKALDISTVGGADDAILAMDAALKSVNSARANLGAMQNRFESVVSNLSVNSENLQASKSRIMDADFASETANLSRSQILQQAGTAMVAQANQLPQGVLSLLR